MTEDMTEETNHGRWKLPDELKKLSVGQRWPDVLDEWELELVEPLDPEQDAETCLCGHHPIRELCHMHNKLNESMCIVGNCCVKKFGKPEFEGTDKIFDAVHKIKADITASANNELLLHARKRRVLTDKEFNFYSDIWRKRKLSDKQQRWKLDLNRKIIESVSRRAVRPLQECPKYNSIIWPTSLPIVEKIKHRFP